MGKEIYVDNKAEQTKVYLNYINEHIANVVKCSYKYINELKSIFDIDEVEFYYQIANHDKSKFSEEEFEPYANRFYPIRGEDHTNARSEFDAAWVHHYLHNPHHPEYWNVLNTTGVSIPDKYIAEMLCDWLAMSMKFGTYTKEWYLNSDKPEMLNEAVKEKLDKFFELMDSKYGNKY